MSKIGHVMIVVGVVAVAYLLLLVVMPVLADFASTANTTMAASSNMSNYPGMQEATLSTPWIMFFVPGVIGMVVIVVILKQP